MAFEIVSTTYPDGGITPRKFTCDGADVFPTAELDAGAKSLHH